MKLVRIEFVIEDIDEPQAHKLVEDAAQRWALPIYAFEMREATEIERKWSDEQAAAIDAELT